MSGHMNFLAASDAVRFVVFGALMTLLLGSIAWASFIDEWKERKARLRDRSRRRQKSDESEQGDSVRR